MGDGLIPVYLVFCDVFGEKHVHLFIPGWRRHLGPIIKWLLYLVGAEIVLVDSSETRVHDGSN